MGAMPSLAITWDGKEYRCKATMDVLMHIEDKITISSLATKAASGDIPSVHVSWVFYCLLVGAGVQTTPEAVWDAMKVGNMPTSEIVGVCTFLISEIYGVGPEAPEDIGLEEGEKK